MNDFEPGRSEDKNQPKINEDSIQTSQLEAQSKTATGPRTSGGKRRSKMNAAKHGIFTAGILEGVERKADHDKLVDELRDHFQPHGTFEELLVEKLAMLYPDAARSSCASKLQHRNRTVIAPRLSAGEFPSYYEDQS